MYSEILGLVTSIVTFAFMAFICRLFGKQGLIAWAATDTIIASIQVIKTVGIFGISAILGNVMFASVYLATDILNDIYGRRVAKRAVWLGFSSTLIIIVVMQLLLYFIPVPEDVAQKTLHTVFGIMSCIALGSVVAYTIGQYIDVFIFSLIKKVFSSGETFFIRAYGSTFLNSIIDTAILVAIAPTGGLSGTIVFEIFTTIYVLKLASTVLNVPSGYTAKSFYRKGKVDELDQGY